MFKRWIVKQVTPFMVAAVKTHEQNTLLTIRCNGRVLVKCTLADIRLIETIRDYEGIGLQVSLETQPVACVDPDCPVCL